MRRIIVVMSIAALAVFGIAACEPLDEELSGTSQESPGDPIENAEGEESPGDPTEDAEGEDLTPGQSNAVRSAEQYLSIGGFSRQGLIDQLTFEDYEAADAEFAVDHIAPDWNEQAVRAAENYMTTSPFSQQGLIDQLMFEGFTPEQAEYGAASQF